MRRSRPPVSGASQRWLVVTIAIGTTLAPLNSTMIAVALPDIQRAFDASVTATAWLVTLYLIAMAAGLPIGGKLGDIYGRRRIYLLGLGWFAAASLACALAPSLPWLIAFRLQQGLAGTLIFPNGAALLRAAVPQERRGMAFGMIGLAAAVAAASGPPTGGVLVGWLGWSSIFWVNAPLVAIALALGWRSIPYAAGSGNGRFDVPGIALFAAALSSMIVVPTLLKADAPVFAALAAVAGIALGWLFLQWERRVRTPVVDLTVFRRSHFTAACASIMLGNVVMYSTLLAIPLYLEGVRGESVRTTGLMLAAMSAFSALSTPIGGRWMDRRGRWLPAVTGASLVVIGATAVAAGVYLDSSAVTVAALAVLGLGLGIAGAPVQTAAIEAVPEAEAGSAAGIHSTARYVGSVIGSSVLAMLFARQPGAGDAAQFVGLFAGLALVSIAGLVAHANIAVRDPSAPRSTPVRT